MQVKQSSPMNVLSFQKRTTINKMDQYVRIVARQLYAVAYENELEITGPIYWLYYGMDDNPETEFTLKIALPIQLSKTLSTDEFTCECLDAFTCLSSLHTGAWETLPQTYKKLIGRIQTARYSMNGICREIYLHMDFENPQNSITEVQVGIQV